MDTSSFWQIFDKEKNDETGAEPTNLLKQIENLAIQVSKNIIYPHIASVSAAKKNDGSLVTEIDIKAHGELTRKLIELVDLPVLSEELRSSEQEAILETDPPSYWCIDPIDGTSNYVAGIPYWCVSIALIIDGKITLGVVYDVSRDECFSATNKSGSTLNGQALLVNNKNQLTELKDCMAMIDFKRLQPVLAQKLVTNPPYRSLRSFGASALDLCWIAAQRCHVYMHGQQKLWDHAAGLLVLKQVGAVAETFEGAEVSQNDLQFKSILAASTPQLMEKWKAYYLENK